VVIYGDISHTFSSKEVNENTHPKHWERTRKSAFSAGEMRWEIDGASLLVVERGLFMILSVEGEKSLRTTALLEMVPHLSQTNLLRTSNNSYKAFYKAKKVNVFMKRKRICKIAEVSLDFTPD
jgi:hypothetical protein